ncbi:MAG: aminopeptidase [Anaerolineales bacterium]
MTDQRTVNLARILVNYSVNVQRGERVAIMGTSLAAPLLLEIQRAALQAGGQPDLIAMLPGADYIYFTEADEEQLQYQSPLMKMVLEEYEVIIQIMSSANTRELANVPPAKQGLRAKAMAESFKRYVERGASGELKWNISIYPTPAAAQEAEMSLSEFEDFVYGATFADHENPVSAWNEIHALQQRLVDWLAGKKHVVVQGPDVDLKLSIEGRTFDNSDGRHNMPSGEVFTSPVEDSVEGWIRFSYPAIQSGKRVENVELTFEKGKVVKATASKNEDFLNEMLDVDRGARYLGEFAVGTNHRIDRFIGNMLFDEKMGGTIHLAVGTGFPNLGSKNESGIHCDMLCDMKQGGRIVVDGELFYESGEFKV